MAKGSIETEKGFKHSYKALNLMMSLSYDHITSQAINILTYYLKGNQISFLRERLDRLG